jgi:hypothetical protein
LFQICALYYVYDSWYGLHVIHGLVVSNWHMDLVFVIGVWTLCKIDFYLLCEILSIYYVRMDWMKFCTHVNCIKLLKCCLIFENDAGIGSNNGLSPSAHNTGRRW